MSPTPSSNWLLTRIFEQNVFMHRDVHPLIHPSLVTHVQLVIWLVVESRHF